MFLYTDDDAIVVETSCKTKRCITCRKKVQNRFTMLVEYGIMSSSTQDRSYFITTTFKLVSPVRRAPYVAGVWRKALEFLRSKYGKNLQWIKVVELTAKKMPHLHLVMTVIGGGPKATCQPKGHRYDARWRSGMGKCECLEHSLADAWYRISGDSFVVNVSELKSRKKAARYLAQYIGKDLVHLQGLLKSGFKRSWSRSRTWPGEKLQLKRTAELGKDAWRSVWYMPPARATAFTGRRIVDALAYSEGHALSERTGTDLAVQLGAERDRARIVYTMEGWRDELALQTRIYNGRDGNV